jgi:hypothetical protein
MDCAPSARLSADGVLYSLTITLTVFGLQAKGRAKLRELVKETPMGFR